MEGVTHSSVGGRVLEKSPAASTSSSPLCLTFSLLLSYIHAGSHFVSKMVPHFLVFLAIVTSFLVLLITSKSELLCLSSSLCFLLSDLFVTGCPWTGHSHYELQAGGSCRGAGCRADSLTFHMTLSMATADNACQSQAGTSSSFPTQEMHRVSLTL